MNPSSPSFPVSLVAEAREEHEARLRRYVHRILHDEARARDVVQDTFLTLARQPAEPDLRPRLTAWLFTVCRRKALNQIRAESRHVPLESVEPMPSAEASPADQAQLSEERHQLLGLVERLPATQREVVRLRYKEGFSYQEIGAITEHSVSHVGVLLHAALQSLRREWRAGAAV